MYAVEAAACGQCDSNILNYCPVIDDTTFYGCCTGRATGSQLPGTLCSRLRSRAAALPRAFSKDEGAAVGARQDGNAAWLHIVRRD